MDLLIRRYLKISDPEEQTEAEQMLYPRLSRCCLTSDFPTGVVGSGLALGEVGLLPQISVSAFNWMFSFWLCLFLAKTRDFALIFTDLPSLWTKSFPEAGFPLRIKAFPLTCLNQSFSLPMWK